VVDGGGFGRAEVGVDVAGGLARVGAVPDLPALDVLPGVALGESGVDPVDGVVDVAVDLGGGVGGNLLEDGVLDGSGAVAGDLFGFGGGHSGGDGEVVVILGQELHLLADDDRAPVVDASVPQCLQGAGEAVGEGGSGLDEFPGGVFAG